MATTRNRTYRVLAWALAIALTVLSLPIVPFSTWSSNLTNAIGDSMSINAHATTYDGRDRLGVWWWYPGDWFDNQDKGKGYLDICEQMGATEVYFYGYSYLTNPTSSNLSKLHTFVAEAMKHGMRVSIMIDDPALVTNASSSKSTIQKLATGVEAYWAAYPDDWLYGIHFDSEPGNYTKETLQCYIDRLVTNALTYLAPKHIYCEFDVNPCWDEGTGVKYPNTDTPTYTGFYKILANVLAGGVGCVSLMSYRGTAIGIWNRANEGTEHAVTQCLNAGCDVTLGMECTPGWGKNVSLYDSGVKTKPEVETMINSLQGWIKNGYSGGNIALPQLPGDCGVAVHHAQSFCDNFTGNFVNPKSYAGGGTTVSRTQGTYTAPPQTTTTTKNTSGMTLTKQALYYKSGLNVALADYGQYTDTAMTTAILNDYNTNGMISTAAGEYYEVKVTGKGNASGDVYPILFSGDTEYWAGSYPNGSSISTSQNTVTAVYRVNGKTGDPMDIDFGAGAGFGVSLESASSYTLNTIEINVYRYTSGGGGDTTQSSQSQTQPSQVTGDNLLINGDFKVTNTGDSKFGWNVSKTDTKNNVYSDGSFYIDNGNTDSKAMYQTVSFIPGHSYTLSCTIPSTSKNLKLSLDGSTYIKTDINGDFSYTFTATEGMDRVLIGASNSTYTITSAVLVDNTASPSTPTSQSSSQSSSSSTTKTTTTTKAATTTQAVTPTGNNLLKNGDFGITDTKNSEFGWSAEKFNSISGGVASVTNGNEDKKGLKQFVTFEPGETYVLSGTIADASSPVMLFLSNASGATHVTTLPNGQFSYTFTADSSMNCVLFGGYQYTFKISDVQLHKAGSGEEESSVPAATYTVSVTNGTTDKATAAAGETVTITANGAATGKQFKNWTTSDATLANANNAVTTFVMPAKNVAVTANYENISYNVAVSLGTAKVNGVAVTKAQYGQTVSLTADTPATGMEFDKWVTKSGSAPVTFASTTSASTTFTMPAGAVSVEATYKAKTYTVTVNNGSASPTSQMYNNTVTITANAAQAGYKFKNWTTSDGVSFANASNATTTFTMPAKDVTVTANYEKINYTVSVTGGTASKTTANYGDVITLTPSAAPTGQVFDKWTVTPNTVTISGNQFTMPASNVTITASYKNAAYTVTVNNGSASPAGGAMGDKITITANAPATGYVFDKWTTNDGVSFANANNATTTFTLPAKNVTVTANYKKATYAVSVTYGSANPTSAQMGDTVSITAQTRSGYVFDKWTSSDVSFANANSSTTTFTMPAKAVSVTATYKQLYTVSVTGGTASPSSAVAGTEITLTPESRSGWTFSNWSSSDVTVVNNKFTMPSKNVSVTANFTEVIVDPDPPATPTLVSATADGYNVIFKWNAVSGAAGYRVYRKSGSGSYATVKDITGGTTATYTDEALDKGTYTYTVQAYVNGTSGKIWGDYNATGKSATVTFGTPTLTSATASAAGITVAWQKVNGATGYRLYRKDGTNWVTVKTIADANTVSYLAKGLISGQTYTYTVQAYYDSTVTGTTQWSDYDKTGVSAKADFGSPEPGGGADGMKITINWEAVSGAEGYRIYRKTADTSWRTVATVEAPTTTYTDENPVANVYYTYTVQAYTTEGGVKIYSTYDATGTTQRVVLGTPNLSEAEVTGEGVVVSWEAVTGATGYRLYRWNGTAWKTVKTVIGINTVSYTDTNVNAVAGAKYTVQAFRNADGVNVWSDHQEAGVTAQ